MKIIITAALLIIFLHSFSQTDTIQKNAVFLSYNEFANNTPSIKGINIYLDQKALDKFELMYDSAGVQYIFSRPLWGFSDSNNVYIKYKNRYALFIEIGKICMFRYFEPEKKKLGYGPPTYFNGRSESTFRIVKTPRQEMTFALNTETGEIIEIKPSNMNKIITDDPDLLKQFNNEGSNKEGEILTYIRTYNQHHH